MAVTPPRAHDLALALADAAEAPHFHHLASRTPRRIFATLDASVSDLNLMFDPDLRDFYRIIVTPARRLEAVMHTEPPGLEEIFFY